MDLVVTVPKNFTHPDAPGKRGLAAWIAEGDAAGDEPSGILWVYSTSGPKPKIEPGERVYVLCEGRIRGYAPLVEMRFHPYRGANSYGRIELLRAGDAVAVTIPDTVRGFQGWRYRWWQREAEILFPGWKDPEGGPQQQPKERLF